jgi:hypothetical protein
MSEILCWKCGKQMSLQCTEPGVRGHINRVFDCRQCGSEKTIPEPATRRLSWNDAELS